MDALSRLLTLNDPQGSIDKNCLLSRDWQLPHAAGELSVIRWHTVTQGAAQLDLPDGSSYTLHPGTKLRPQAVPVRRGTNASRLRKSTVAGIFTLFFNRAAGIAHSGPRGK